jgi:hypothetical protein
MCVCVCATCSNAEPNSDPKLNPGATTILPLPRQYQQTRARLRLRKGVLNLKLAPQRLRVSRLRQVLPGASKGFGGLLSLIGAQPSRDHEA